MSAESKTTSPPAPAPPALEDVTFTDLAAVWERVGVALRRLVSEDVFQRLFVAVELVQATSKGAVLAVPSDMHLLWIGTNYRDALRAAFGEAASVHGEIELIIAGEPLPTTVEKPDMGAAKAIVGDRSATKTKIDEPSAKEKATAALDKRLDRLGINPEFDFAGFVVGQNSQFAHAACLAVASGKSQGMNPLFIHSKPGLGKTHLVSALSREVVSQSAKKRVAFMTGEVFVNSYIEALKLSKIESFRKKHRNLDLLVIDDVQFLAGKERTQEEFFHTFGALMNARTQIVLVSDRPAREIQNLEPRLVSRFEGGTTVELKVPGVETRMAILRSKMDTWDLQLDDQVVSEIANRLNTNVRKLIGGLNCVANHRYLYSEEVTIERAIELIAPFAEDDSLRRISIEEIQEAVCDKYHITYAEMLSRKRPNRIAFPRQVAMMLCRELTEHSFQEISQGFNRRDHGTVMHACDRVAEVCAKEPGKGSTIDELRHSLIG